MKLTQLDNDTKCDLSDSVLEIHPKLSVKLQNTILNLINVVTDAQLTQSQKEHDGFVAKTKTNFDELLIEQRRYFEGKNTEAKSVVRTKLRKAIEGIDTAVDPHAFGTGCPSCGEEVGTSGEVVMGKEIMKQAVLNLPILREGESEDYNGD